MAALIYKYRVGGGPSSGFWVLHSYDPLPETTTIGQVKKLATIGHRRFTHWWVWCSLCGVSVDLEHACQALRRVKAGATCSDEGSIGRLAHDIDLEDCEVMHE
jgi:hypothetical protein